MSIIDQMRIGWALAKLLTEMTGKPMVVTVRAVILWRVLYPDTVLKMDAVDDEHPKWIEVTWSA